VEQSGGDSWIKQLEEKERDHGRRLDGVNFHDGVSGQSPNSGCKADGAASGKNACRVMPIGDTTKKW
jgi:hypothetical protein